LNQLLGTEVPPKATERILAGLGFKFLAISGQGDLAYKRPTWRSDVAREVDLVEEVARHHGLHKVSPTLPPARSVEGLRPYQVRERAVREVLVGAGLSEVVTYAFVAQAASASAGSGAIPLLNPLSEDQAVLRQSLVVPGLLNVLGVNLRQGRRDVRVFEIGAVFFPERPLPIEQKRLGVLLHGTMGEAHWSKKRQPVDYFDGKGLVEVIARRLGVPVVFEREGVPAYLHPGQSALVVSGGQHIGSVGVLHPDLAGKYELREAAVVVELTLDGILAVTPAARRLEAIPRFPAVARDLSIECDEDRSAQSLEKEIRAAGGRLLQAVTVADRYTGDNVARGKMSLTVTLRYQHEGRTLTSEEVQQSVDQVVAALHASGAKVRGE
jgi:phenylalanyl-tRNA synthetase beta chain